MGANKNLHTPQGNPSVAVVLAWLWLPPLANAAWALCQSVASVSQLG